MKEILLKGKTKKFLHGVLCLFLLITFRVWHLSFVQRDELKDQAKRPQRRMIIEHANRGIICDRFDKPIAINSIRYNATIYYSHLRQIPMTKWIKDKKGNKIKTYPRKEYIEKLSIFLATELDMDSVDIEDMIHAKASILPNSPFIIKENISEKQYFRLRFAQRKWEGLHSELSSERYYPLNQSSSSILGYMGAISQNEYLSIANEISFLDSLKNNYYSEEYFSLPDKFTTPKQAFDRLNELKERAYTINDFIGKCGIEGSFEEILRGFYGKKYFEVDINGKFLRELPISKKPLPGEKIKLTISSELQQFAENLLCYDEKLRDNKSRYYDKTKKQYVAQKQPWIKGGAIIAIDPNNGEVIALASYPRFNPNDFIRSSNNELFQQKQRNIHKWLETSTHIANIYDGKVPLSREIYDFTGNKLYNEEKFLSFPYFIESILPNKDNFISIITDIKQCIQLQEIVEDLLFLSSEKDIMLVFDMLFPKDEGHICCGKVYSEKDKQRIKNAIKIPLILEIKNTLLSFLFSFKHNKDKLFVIDICKTIVNSPSFSDQLIDQIGNITIEDYWNLSKASIKIEEIIKNEIFYQFKKTFFSQWRKDNQKEYLKNIRKEEKNKNISPRPYIDYIRAKEKELFKNFWDENRLTILSLLFNANETINDEQLKPYIDHLTEEKTNEKYSAIEEYTLIKEKLLYLDKNIIIDFFRTIRSFSDLDRTLFSNPKKNEQDLASSFYPKLGFGYGRSQAYSQAAPLGSIFKLITAYTALKQKYFENDASSSLNPFSMIDDIKWNSKGEMIVGFGLDKKAYPRFYKGGRLLQSSHSNIGLVDITSAIERSSNPYFSILAGDYIKNPLDLLSASQEFGFGKPSGIDLPGEFAGNLPQDIDINKTSLYSFAVGQHSLVVTPLQTSIMLSAIANGGYILKPYVRKDNKSSNIHSIVFLPADIQHMIFDGMDKVISSANGNARPTIIRKCRQNKKNMGKLYFLISSIYWKD